MNLSMASKALNHDLLTTKLHVYGHRMRYLNLKAYNIIIYVHDVTTKILSRDSNYIADVAM